MLVEIDEEVFTASDHPPVIALLDMIATERHEWRPTVAAADAAGQFLAQAAPMIQGFSELVQKCLVEAANPATSAGPPVRVCADQLRELVGDLQRPAVLVVEDGINEECFLLAVARAFGRSNILVAKAAGWLEFAHAGGVARIGQFVARHRARFHVLGAVRVAALLDSDRPIPRQRTANHDQADAIAAVQGCAVHVWERRHVESYLPTVVWLHHFPDRPTKIGMLLEMRPDQRAVLHMKKGLAANRAPAEVYHFRDLPAEVRRQWRTGLKLQGAPLVPDEVPLSEADFAELGEAAVAELRAVLAMIERIL